MIMTLDEAEKFLSEWRNNNPYFYFGCVSGGFDPIHKGHVSYIRESASKCPYLVAIVNGDSFLKRKKGYAFMTADERATIVDNIKGVALTIIYESESDTVDEVLKKLKPTYFFKGGDRTGKDNIPEWKTCALNDITLVVGVGGGKVQSSSELVEKLK